MPIEVVGRERLDRVFLSICGKKFQRRRVHFDFKRHDSCCFDLGHIRPSHDYCLGRQYLPRAGFKGIKAAGVPKTRHRGAEKKFSIPLRCVAGPPITML